MPSIHLLTPSRTTTHSHHSPRAGLTPSRPTTSCVPSSGSAAPGATTTTAPRMGEEGATPWWCPSTSRARPCGRCLTVRLLFGLWVVVLVLGGALARSYPVYLHASIVPPSPPPIPNHPPAHTYNHDTTNHNNRHHPPQRRAGHLPRPQRRGAPAL